MSTTKLKVQIANLEDSRRELENQRKSANTQYTVGLVAVLVGIFLIAFTGVWWLGAFFLIAGGLAAVTQYRKRKEADQELTTTNRLIQEKRNRLIKTE